MIRALCEYYDNLRKQPNTDLIPQGYSSVSVNWNLVLKKDGGIKSISPYTVPVIVGKKTKEVGRTEIFPFRNSIPGIAAETIDHREKYIFGLAYDKATGQFTTDKSSLAAFEKCKAVNLAFLEDIHNDVAEAYKKFMLSWVPQEHLTDEHMLELGKNYPSAKFVITVEGQEDSPLNTKPDVKEKWDKSLSSVQGGDELGQCAVTGEKNVPLARVHDNISGVAGGQASGTNLVSFNNTAFTSYNREQSYNSSISVATMKKYTAALNYLTSLTSKMHKQIVDDMTILFWANTSSREDPYLNSFVCALFASGGEEAEENLKALFDKLSDGVLGNLDGIDPSVEFYVLAIKPNVSRLSVKMFEKSSFGKMMENLKRHRDDMSMSPDDKQLAVWQICSALKSPKSKDKLDPSLQVNILLAALNGTPYPQYMLETAVRRARSDQDDPSKKFASVNRQRVRIIRACLIRNKKIEQGGYKMLNENSTDAAYNLGRLFAALEKAQQDALGGNINATIKDKFFSSACSTPNLVFPRLLKLAQTHIAKLGTGAAIYYDKLIQEILGKISDGFPRTLNTEKQGMFILGYYQQKNKFYEKNTDKGEE